MGNKFVYSLEDNEEYYNSVMASQEIEEYTSTKDNFNEIENRDILFKYLKHLSIIDSTFVMLSYMYRMSQTSISNFLKVSQIGEISQVGVSVRIRRAFEKIKFLFNFPKLDLIDIREDFRFLFPKHLFEAAYYFYWNRTQSRTKYFLNMTQCGSAFKIDDVLEYLNLLVKENKDIEKTFLAQTYLEFFNKIRYQSNIMNIFFRNENNKFSDIVEKTSIFE